MRFVVLTMFPELFPGPLGVSVLGRGLHSGIWGLEVISIKQFAKKSRVDDSPCGGGPGMIMRADVLGDAMDSVLQSVEPSKRFVLSPRGKSFSQETACQLSLEGNVVLICGRFEGIDQRFIDHYNCDELSVGDYVLSGGELAAMSVIDACVRLLPGVLGNCASLDFESISSGMLEYDQYTKPVVWRDKSVPGVLLSGNHREIDRWRYDSSRDVTARNRPDLVKK